MTTHPYRDKSDDDMYCFISEENFQKKKDAGKFFETSQYAGHWYGTPKFEYKRAVKGGYHIIKALDSDGAQTVKEILGDDCILFYVSRKKEYIIESLVMRAITNSTLINDITTRIMTLFADCPDYPVEHIVYNDGTVEGAAKQVASYIDFTVNSEKYGF